MDTMLTGVDGILQDRGQYLVMSRREWIQFTHVLAVEAQCVLCTLAIAIYCSFTASGICY